MGGRSGRLKLGRKEMFVGVDISLGRAARCKVLNIEFANHDICGDQALTLRSCS